jgi:hypothetical protein
MHARSIARAGAGRHLERNAGTKEPVMRSSRWHEMEADKLPNELDRKHATRQENRKRAITYKRKHGWHWPDNYFENRLDERKLFDKRNEREFQDKQT